MKQSPLFGVTVIFLVLHSYLVSENFSDTPKSLVDVGYDEADTTGILV